jgi:SAM-dependent methyltransferase
VSPSHKPYLSIVRHYESCLARHGDSHLGVDWPEEKAADVRYRVMLDVIHEQRESPVSLLDFGCGASHLLHYIRRTGIGGIAYSGLDISESFVALSRSKNPEVTYWCADVLDESVQIPKFDYVVMNGVFTIKRELPYDEMFAYTQRVIERMFQSTLRGLAFNVMSKHVDWERADLFHLPFDDAAAWLGSRLTRNYVIRADYRLHEYTIYVYR